MAEYYDFSKKDNAERTVPAEGTSASPDLQTGEAPAAPAVKKRRFGDGIIVTCIAAFLLMNLGQMLGVVFEFIPYFRTASDAVQTAVMYFEFIGIWIVFYLYFLISLKDRPIMKAIGTRPRGNNIGMFLLGFVVFGFGLNSICAGTAMLNGDIYIYFDSVNVPGLLLVLLAVLVQSGAEELVCRGFIYQRLRRSYKNPWVAIIANSALFALLHIFNPGVNPLAIADIFVTGILFSFMVYYMDSIWCAIAAHTAWNFTQNIIFGLPNSGLVVPFSVYKLDAASATNSFAYNVGFGVEGTVLSVIVLSVASLAIWLWGRKHAKPEYDVWN